MNDIKKQKGWFFPKIGGGTEEGFNHAGIQTFGAEPDHYLPRETIQNSLDAKDPSKKNEPVVVEFKRFKVPIEHAIPNLPEYIEILKKCKESCAEQTDKKGKIFFTNALAVCKNKNITVLKISDYGTTGIEKINKNVGRWHNLIKMKGTSVAEGKSGGTYGIAKSAPYITSGLRTLFYYTKNKDGNCGFIWKSIFTAHDNNPKRGNEGFYCHSFEHEEEIITEGFTDNNQQNLIERTVNGTDIIILDHQFEQKKGDQPWNIFYE